MKQRIGLREPATIALENMRTHKLRSFLTLLGVILAVFTLIIVVALIEGTNRYIANKVANLGSNVFLVTRFGIINDTDTFVRALRRNKKITWDDYIAVRDGMKLARNVGLETRRNGRLKFGDQTVEDVDIRGVTANIGMMDVQEPREGRYITDSDNEHRTNVTLIGADVADKLFPGVEPMGKTLYVDGKPFEIVGVAKAIGTVFGQSQDNYVYLPIQTHFKIYGAIPDNMAINVQALGPTVQAQAQEEARTIMRGLRHLKPGEEDSFGIFGADTLMDLWKQLTGTLATGMVGFVALFMVIGGVVVMNVMLASVTERTREIGVRKSLGASRRDILLQFLIEAGVMTFVGGALGIAMAWLVAFVVNLAAYPMAVPISAVITALGVSTAVGLFFGLYPANKAAKLDPIEALRYE